MTEWTTNPKRELARVAKAAKMADVIATLELADDPHLLEALAAADEGTRHMVAVLAEVNDPSEATWAAVLAVVADRTAHGWPSKDSLHSLRRAV